MRFAVIGLSVLLALGVTSAAAAPPAGGLDDLDRVLGKIDREQARAGTQARLRASTFAGPATDAMGVLTYGERFIRLIVVGDMGGALELKARAALAKASPPDLDASSQLSNSLKELDVFAALFRQAPAPSDRASTWMAATDGRVVILERAKRG